MDELTTHLPVARVAVDVPLAHLDRPFDYAVPDALADDAVPGARVRVRFAGRLRDGFVLERAARGEDDRALAPLQRVTSAEPVLQPQIVRLVRAVADHYAGTFADVVRLAVPPRHGITENADPPSYPAPTTGHAPATVAGYPDGPRLLAAIGRGAAPGRGDAGSRPASARRLGRCAGGPRRGCADRWPGCPAARPRPAGSGRAGGPVCRHVRQGQFRDPDRGRRARGALPGVPGRVARGRAAGVGHAGGSLHPGGGSGGHCALRRRGRFLRRTQGPVPARARWWRCAPPRNAVRSRSSATPGPPRCKRWSPGVAGRGGGTARRTPGALPGRPRGRGHRREAGTGSGSARSAAARRVRGDPRRFGGGTGAGAGAPRRLSGVAGLRRLPGTGTVSFLCAPAGR